MIDGEQLAVIYDSYSVHDLFGLQHVVCHQDYGYSLPIPFLNQIPYESSLFGSSSLVSSSRIMTGKSRSSKFLSRLNASVHRKRSSALMTEVLHSKAFQQFLCLLYGGLFRQPRNLPVKYKASQVLNWSGREALASSRLPPGQLAWFGFHAGSFIAYCT